jgi:hypothetical protein
MLLRTQKKRQDGLSSVAKLDKRQELCQTNVALVDKVTLLLLLLLLLPAHASTAPNVLVSTGQRASACPSLLTLA